MFLEGFEQFLSGLTIWGIVYYFWPFFIFDFARYTLTDILLVAIYCPRRVARRKAAQSARKRIYRELPLVSIIAPGRNESANLERLVASVQRQTYPRIELIVVDDGSDDGMANVGRRLERNGRISLFVRNSVRGGKASAANTALHYCHGDYIVHLDADSNLRHQAIERILMPFYMERNIGAVGGDIRVDNLGESFATRLQGIEYIKALTTGRTVTSILGILRIVPGAYGAFSHRALRRVGGWDIGPGLDGDIVLKLRKSGYRVIHEPESVCHTSVPSSFRKLMRQRYRWDRSLVRFRLRKHGDLFTFNSNFRWLNFISALDNVVFALVLNAKWWIYVVQMAVFYTSIVPYIFILNYLLYVLVNLIQYTIARAIFWSSLRSKDLVQFFFVPLMPLYMGIFLRLVRTFAQIMELLHGESYYDSWNPWKVSSVARKNRM